MQSNDIAHAELRTSGIARLSPPKQARVYNVQGLGSKLGVIGHVSYRLPKIECGPRGTFRVRSRWEVYEEFPFLENLLVQSLRNDVDKKILSLFGLSALIRKHRNRTVYYITKSTEFTG